LPPASTPSVAIGATAIGTPSHPRGRCRRTRFGTVKIDELTIKRLRVIETAG
jgi:hypothetical protein